MHILTTACPLRVEGPTVELPEQEDDSRDAEASRTRPCSCSSARLSVMVVESSKVTPSLIKGKLQKATCTLCYGSCFNLRSCNTSVSSLFSTMDRASQPG